MLNLGGLVESAKAVISSDPLHLDTPSLQSSLAATEFQQDRDGGAYEKRKRIGPKAAGNKQDVSLSHFLNSTARHRQTQGSFVAAV